MSGHCATNTASPLGRTTYEPVLAATRKASLGIELPLNRVLPDCDVSGWLGYTAGVVLYSNHAWFGPQVVFHPQRSDRERAVRAHSTICESDDGMRFPWLFILLSALLAPSCGPRPKNPEQGRPNVILISIDTLRRDHVGFYGYWRDTTPRLDELALESVVFERAYTSWTWTLAAHMTMLTGLSPSQHGVWRVGSQLQESSATLAERLSSQGYHCVGLYYPGWLNPEYGFERGFDVYREHADAEEAAEHLHEALQARPADAPLFLFVQLMDVHSTPLPQSGSPYDPPVPFHEQFLVGALERLTDLPGRAIWMQDGSAVTPDQHEAIVALYDGGIRYVDQVLGGWIDEWRTSGLLDRSMLVVTSDHGEGLFQRGDRYGGHGSGYEEGLRVPLMVRYPGARGAGSRLKHPVAHIDLVPTVLESLGLPSDPRLPGRPLENPREAGAPIVAENPRIGAEVIVCWPLKLVRIPRSGQSRVVDLVRDPGELDSVHEALQPDEFARLSASILERAAKERSTWLVVGEDAPDEPPQEKLSDELRALGYGGD